MMNSIFRHQKRNGHSDDGAAPKYTQRVVLSPAALRLLRLCSVKVEVVRVRMFRLRFRWLIWMRERGVGLVSEVVGEICLQSHWRKLRGCTVYVGEG